MCNEFFSRCRPVDGVPIERRDGWLVIFWDAANARTWIVVEDRTILPCLIVATTFLQVFFCDETSVVAVSVVEIMKVIQPIYGAEV
jgi:hypothetical protein